MTRPRVLVVDDEPGVRHAVERVLENQCEVASCSGSRQALERAGDFRPDLAVIDVQLPEMDGFALLNRLKERLPELDVILMTGTLHEIDAKMARSVREKAFFFLQKPFERDLLLSVFDRWRELRELERQNREHTARLERDLRDAREFQRSLLPPASAVLNGIELHGRFHPCEEVAGDFYDYVATADGGVSLLVADVAGHGVAAAMLMGLIKTAFHTAHAEGHEPLAVVERVRQVLLSTEAERFVTMAVAKISPAERRLRHVSAGHPDAVLWSGDGELRELPPTGPLISSALPEASWEEKSIGMGPGEHLLLLTDGIEETRSEQDIYGRQRLYRAILARGEGGAGLLDGILNEVIRFRGQRPVDDDYTMLLASVLE